VNPAYQPPPQPAGTCICERCGGVGKPRSITEGSILIEGCLWVLFCLPGVLYSIWRLTTRRKACPACGGTMVPYNSPRGQMLYQQMYVVAPPVQVVQPPIAAPRADSPQPGGES